MKQLSLTFQTEFVQLDSKADSGDQPEFGLELELDKHRTIWDSDNGSPSPRWLLRWMTFFPEALRLREFQEHI